MNREYSEVMNGLRFSSAAKERMATELVAAMERDREDQARPVACAESGRGKRRWRYPAAVAAAMALVAVLAGGAYATGALMSMGNVMDDVFGGPPAQTQVVDKIGRPIGASADSNGITITADAVIGDQANYVVVFSIAKDDGTAFQGIEPSDKGLLPLGFEGGGGVHVDGVLGSGGSGYFYDADPSDNAIQYVEKISVTSGTGGIIGRTARVSLQNLFLYGEGEQQTIAEGTWKMKFVMDYEDTSIALPSGLPFELNGMKATLDSASISPVALTLSFTVDAAMDWQDQDSGRLSERNSNEIDRFTDPEITLNMKDGTVEELDASRGAAGTQKQGDTTVSTKNIVFDTFLDLGNVASITLGGKEIPLS